MEYQVFKNSKLKSWFKTSFPTIFRIRDFYYTLKNLYYQPFNHSKFGQFGKNAVFQAPASVTNYGLIYLDDYTRVRSNLSFDGTRGKLIIKKYSAIGRNTVVVTGNHTKTVGIPQVLLGPLHINDRHTDIIIEEDVWTGANCTFLPGCHIGRGAVVGACSLVNKELPPYAVAVGTPCKIIASSYSLEDVIKHESYLYPPEERFSREFLEDLFKTYYNGKKPVGIDNLTESEIKSILSNLK